MAFPTPQLENHCSAGQSRRKQTKPGKFGMREEKATESRVEPKITAKMSMDAVKFESIIKSEIVDQGLEKCINSNGQDFLPAILKGSTFGPFSVTPCLSATKDFKPGNDNIQLRDKAGKGHWFQVKDELEHQFLSQLNLSPSNKKNANSKLCLETPGSLRLVVTKDVKSLSELVAFLELSPSTDVRKAASPNQKSPKPAAESQPIAKNFKCDRCGTSFSVLSTLEAHRAYYCSELSTKETLPDTLVSDRKRKLDPSLNLASSGAKNKRPGSAASLPTFAPLPVRRPAVVPQFLPRPAAPNPNAILLPVGTCESGIQIVGQPQIIIPVAVPAQSQNFLMQPLILEEAWVQQVNIPTRSVPVMTGLPNECSIPLVIRRTPFANEVRAESAEPADSSDPVESLERSNSADRSEKKVVEPEPLDLSISKEAGNGTVSKSESIRNFYCDKCGIRFSSAKTLEGHATFYCKATKLAKEAEQSIPNRILPKSPELACSLCQYTAPSSAQMSQHMKSAHSLIHGYLCLICGYKGYSVRGMKSHMKTHEECSKLSDDLPPEFVQLIPNENSPRLFVKRDPISPSVLAAAVQPSNSLVMVQQRKPPPPALLCQICHEAFEDMVTYADHCCSDDGANQSAEETEVPECGKNGQQYTCQYCNYKSPYKGNVKRHLVLVHKIEQTKDD